MPQKLAGFPEDTYQSRSRRVGLCDFLTRRFAQRIPEAAGGRRGTGRSGEIRIARPGQEVLERTSVCINEDRVEARFTMGLPARGRRVMGQQAEEMFFGELPSIVGSALRFGRLESETLYSHIETIEDQDVLRERLGGLGLVAFVPDDAVLPRGSGVEARPMVGNRTVPFETPESFRVTVELPNRGKISGMGVPGGITLIVGGGYHGKSTLLRALEAGVYNHIPGDGRELAVTVEDAVKIRAEDGRRIEQVDIRPFIGNLPYRGDTSSFSTGEASGSTSQAANIIESLEAGTSLLLIDEDTSATNFMIRDHRMQELVSKDKEPITPFIDRVRQLYDDRGVSTIMVIGGSGDYFDVAHRVIMMDAYRPKDVTDAAASIARRHRSERRSEGGEHCGRVTPRIPLAGSIDARRGSRGVKIAIRGRRTISFGEETIDLSAVEQIVDPGQTAAIADTMLYARDRWMADDRTMREVLEGVVSDFERDGLDVLSHRHVGQYALPRKAEISAAINRLRSLEVRQKAHDG